ncbi:PucR family transcriptional regulator [Blastococcus goldschmidtiae]|uniref:Helix-turn-helix domain-containing protein n=1 Tax=Blastococcus goldschmidtiae TaxID=3075546 RepID=A0ABU2KBA4_9ACTN|nr:helix-turn-helix domain-containing protein [Blastococcus sp. DSM 46792]MDT0277460.1 helix-turn-helix domain-containing protein [Blastococcus sp. DSM 46792]
MSGAEKAVAGGVDVRRALTEVAVAATARHGVPGLLLEGYLPALLDVARTGRRLSAVEESACRSLGAEAVALGVGLPELVDVYMSASRRLWSQLPELVGAVRGRQVHAAELLGIGEAVWQAADAALAALSAGNVEAQRLLVRREEASRREFVDDLLTGRSDVAPLIERAEVYGLRLAAGNVVVVTESDRPIDAGTGIPAGVEDAARARFGGHGLLVAAKDGRVVSVLSCPATSSARQSGDLGRSLAEVAGSVLAGHTAGGRWRAGVGRPHAGPRGVQRSAQEAVEALEMARRLDLPQQVVHAADLLVYRVLARDETAITDLVRAVLEPLSAARGGAEVLVHTLEAYFAAGQNAAGAARQLHVSVRALTYRLQRIRELTGYSVTDPADQLSLLVAVTGARLLDWPHRPLIHD